MNVRVEKEERVGFRLRLWRVATETEQPDPITDLQDEMVKFILAAAIRWSLVKGAGIGDELSVKVGEIDQKVSVAAVIEGFKHIGGLVDKHIPNHATKINLKTGDKAGFVDSAIFLARSLSYQGEVSGVSLFGANWGKVENIFNLYQILGELSLTEPKSQSELINAVKSGFVWANLMLEKLQGATRIENELWVTEDQYAAEARQIGVLMQDVSAALAQQYSLNKVGR